MKKIDSAFRHLPEQDALEAIAHQQRLAGTLEARINYLKEDERGPRQAREELIKKDRRRFLGLVATSGISTSLMRAFPFIGGILASRHAMAQDPLNKRVVFCYVPSGGWQNRELWLPRSVNEMASQTRPYADRNVAHLCAFRKVHVQNAGHSGSRQAFGVFNNTDTMDKRLAQLLGATTPRAGIYLGAQANGDGYQPLCSSMGSCQDDPHQAMKSILGSGSQSNSSVDNTFRIAYDAQLQALESIRSKLSADEFYRYNEHLVSLQKIKSDYEAAATKPTCTSELPIDTSNTQAIGRAQADIIVAALACGVTKVATLQIGHHQGGQWQAHNVANGNDPHGCSHGFGDDSSRFEGLTRYCYDVSAYLLARLRDTAGPDGMPLLSSTVFAQISCMGSGNTHNPDNSGFLLATQMPGFRHGFSIDASHGNRAGSAADFIGAIPKGMGFGAQIPFGGTNTMGLI